MSWLQNLRDFADGKINEAALRDTINNDGIYDFEEDDEFIEECTRACLPTLVQMMIMDESADMLDEDVRDAFIKVNDYFVQQGIISEAASVSLSNPKVTVVRMGKDAQVNRLTTIVALKMARKDNTKSYKKYKFGQKIKKTNLADILNRYGDKARRIALKLYEQNKRSGKVKSITDSKKKKSTDKKTGK